MPCIYRYTFFATQQEPVTMLLGASFKYQRSGGTQRLVEVKETFEYVPLLENLEQFLSNPEVLQEVIFCVYIAIEAMANYFKYFMQVTKSHFQPNDNLLGDFCDGSLYKEHPLFASNDGTLHLQFIVYYDDVEVANPLGSSKGKHKLGNEIAIDAYLQLYLYYF